MSYREYVIGAYVVFAIALLWDWLAPQLQIRAALRAITSHGKRQRAATAPNPELPLSRD